MPILYLMRHGKAENTSPDIMRALSDIGKDNVLSTVKLLKDKNIEINRAIYSPAERTKETALLMCNGLGVSIDDQTEDERIYNASVSELQAVLSTIDEGLNSVLLVGHNPGLAELVLMLCEESVHLSAGNIAVVYAESWANVLNCECKFIEKY